MEYASKIESSIKYFITGLQPVERISAAPAVSAAMHGKIF